MDMRKKEPVLCVYNQVDKSTQNILGLKKVLRRNRVASRYQWDFQGQYFLLRTRVSLLPSSTFMSAARIV